MSVAVPSTRRVRWPGALIGSLGLALLVVSCLLAYDLSRTSDEVQREVGRTETLVLADVRLLGKTQRELLRLLHLLERDAAAGRVERQSLLVGQRARETTRFYETTSLDTDLGATAARHRAVWEVLVRPDVDRALAGGSAAAGARRQAEREILRLERAYDALAARAEGSRRDQVSSTDESATDMSGDLRRLLLLLGLLLAAALASSTAGALLFFRADRHRDRAVRELRDLNDDLTFYSQVVQATDSPLVAVDPDGRLTWVNEAFETATGWRLRAVRGLRPGQFLTGPETDPEVVRRLNADLVAGRPSRFELAHYTAWGEARWMSAHFSPLHGPGGELEGFFGVLTDITERHEAEKLLVAARRAAEDSARQKAAFLATMSHEIRTPLNAVLGLTDLLQLTELDEEQRDYVETAHRSGAHLLALINDVLDYSSLESGRVEYAEEPFSLPGLLAEMATMFATQAELKEVELELVRGPDVPVALRGDETRLRQVLVNLVGNALKFTEQGSVTLACSVAGWGEDATGARTCEVVTTVTDTGIGIPDWRIPDLFQSFVRGDVSSTREYAGTGLGLAISRGLVEAMGGTITLESELGEGTRVVVRTTHQVAGVLADPKGDGPVVAVPEPSGPGLLTVLVAEDDAVNRKVVTGMLGRLGIVPTVVGNGREAVDLVERVPFDVVLMDVEMPVMDGVSAVRRIRDARGDDGPHVIALTANALAGDRERFMDAGMDDYLSKPVTLEGLTTALMGAIRRRSAA